MCLCVCVCTDTHTELHELWVTMELLEGGNLDEAILGDEGAASFQVWTALCVWCVYPV